MLLTTTKTLEGLAAEGCWRLYRQAFDELRIAAVQRHLMTRAEFDQVMVDKRITKYVAVDPNRGGQPCALGTVSNDLESMPLISPDYFAHRWPARYAERRIWYIGFVAIDPPYQGTGILTQIIESMCEVVAGAGGLAVLDICRRRSCDWWAPTSTACAATGSTSRPTGPTRFLRWPPRAAARRRRCCGVRR